MYKNVLIFRKLECVGRPIFNKSLGISRYNWIKYMIVLHNLYWPQVYLRNIKQNSSWNWGVIPPKEKVLPTCNKERQLFQWCLKMQCNLSRGNRFIWTRSCIIYVHKWWVPITDSQPGFHIPLFIDPFSRTRNKRKSYHDHHIIINNVIYLYRMIIWYCTAKQTINANLQNWNKSWNW